MKFTNSVGATARLTVNNQSPLERAQGSFSQNEAIANASVELKALFDDTMKTTRNVAKVPIVLEAKDTKNVEVTGTPPENVKLTESSVYV